MKKFNKYAALSKLDDKNNNKTKKRTIIVCVIVLIVGILYFSFARFESTISFNLINGTVKIHLIDRIINLKSNGSIELEYDGTVDNNLRYVGNNVHNYVEYNNELWRVIGVMNNIEDENGVEESRVKIIRSESLGNYSWDSSDASLNDGSGINQWGESTFEDGSLYEGADLMRELNNDYLGNITVGTDGKWYSKKRNSKDANMPTSFINSDSQQMIQTVKWNLGSNPAGLPDSKDDYFALNVYAYERSDNSSRICEHGISYYGSNSYQCEDTVIRTTIWVGKIALMYPSDFLYATSGGNATSRDMCLSATMYNWNNSDIADCKNNNWLITNSIQLTLTPSAQSQTATSVFGVWTSGYINSFSVSDGYQIRPTLYLKNSAFIASGDGSYSNPYKLTM